MQKQFVSIALISTSLLLSGCDYFKSKKEPVETKEVSEWSCSNPANIDQLQKNLKDDYLKLVDRRLRESKYYEADQALLKTINDNLKFEIKNVRTITEDAANTTQLQCDSQLVVHLPKGLQQRAENAYTELGKECEDGCESGGYDSIKDYLEDGEYSLKLNNNQLTGQFNYDINKTDKDGYTLSAQHQSDVIEGVSFMVVKAVQFASYVKENKEIQVSDQKNTQEYLEQRQLSQKAMDIRKKELLTEKVKQVEQLNQAWDNLSEELRLEHKQEQADWFVKRDVDCNVLAQKSVGQLSEREVETYQQQYNYWDDAMREQNKQMQYNKCFIQRTSERSDYLNNLS
ncbi:hypothetical protein EC844_110105 [Acinetobacter calcoaceticus]|uniref:DUF1311 domain-containing protein n=1 Tax=Acinetobacter calcoaceticus TaxID=471 RepID=A0A4R1XRV2_ACICA|nr:hypothetical protein EC844_110105 [Acinetobacter calcoaceticus]